MPDRFTEESPADRQRFYRLWVDRERYEYDEDGMRVGMVRRIVPDEPEACEAPEQPLCVVGRKIAEEDYGTVRQYLAALKAHKAICPFCRMGQSKKDVRRESGASQTPGKVA
jgi:hypothetical protein